MKSTNNSQVAPIVVVLMGVSGAGKTTIGQRLAARTGWTFLDADDLHPPTNLEKMATGVPLSESDRDPWLKSLRAYIDQQLKKNHPTIVACSALKTEHREMLGTDRDCVELVFLRGTYDQISERITQRSDHFFDSELLTTQFEALEAPTASEALIVDVDGSPERIVTAIQRALSLPHSGSNT